MIPSNYRYRMGLKSNLFRIKVFLKDKDKKPLPVIFREFMGLWWYKKNFPIHYIGRFMYREGFNCPKDYMDMREYKSIVFPKRNNPQEYVTILNNKLIFQVFCEKYNFPIPKMLGYNMQRTFVFQNETNHLTNVGQIKDFFRNLFITTDSDKIFLKAFCGFMGKHIHVLKRNTFEETLDGLGSILLNEAFIYQEGVTQHEEISKIYPKSVNTLRVETFIDETGKPNILGAVLRLGAGGKFVDNVSSGGFFVPIHIETGRLKAKGVRAMIHGGQEISKHPDTDFVFENFKVPFYDKCLELALKLATYMPNKIAGWDMAITEKGPIVIEGNDQPGITMGEMSYGGYAKHPLFNQMRGIEN